MNILDWVFIGIGALWVLRGLMRGAISQIFGVAGIFLGFIVASHEYLQVKSMLVKNFASILGDNTAGPISFILLFLLTWFSIAVVGFWFVRIVRDAGLGFLDRLWGGMIGFGKALLFGIVTVAALTLFSAGGNPQLITGSMLAPKIRDASRFLFKIAPVKVQEELAKKQQDVKKLVSDRTELMLDTFFGQNADSKEKGERNKE